MPQWLNNKSQIRKSLLDVFAEADTNTPARQSRYSALDSICKDLEMLLNTRCPMVSPPIGLKQLEVSLCNYGIADLACVNLGDADQRLRFTQAIQHTLLNFEPRLKHVRVILLDSPRERDSNLHFRIEAVLSGGDQASNVVFDSSFEPVLHNLVLRGRND